MFFCAMRVHQYQCCICGLEWEVPNKIYKGEQGWRFSDWHIPVKVAKSEFRLYYHARDPETWQETGEVFAVHHRLQVVTNVSCWDERCDSVHMEYHGRH